MKLDIAQVQRQAEAVLAEDLYWFPVRHHSPAVSKHLRAAMRERKPKLVLIEGPADANALIEHVVDSKTKPPIALYASFRDDQNVLGLAGVASAAPDIPPRFPVWYPMLPYSPRGTRSSRWAIATRTTKSSGATSPPSVPRCVPPLRLSESRATAPWSASVSCCAPFARSWRRES